jgi:hypothetical protein
MTQYTDLEIPPPPSQPSTAPPSRKRGCLKYGAIGCGSLIVLCALFVAALLIIVTSFFRSSDPYKESLRRAENDFLVTSKLGTSVKAGWFMQGEVNTAGGGGGNANITYSLRGSKAKGSMHVVGKKANGTWKYSEIRVSVEDGTTIDLLGSQVVEQEY